MRPPVRHSLSGKPVPDGASLCRPGYWLAWRNVRRFASWLVVVECMVRRMRGAVTLTQKCPSTITETRAAETAPPPPQISRPLPARTVQRRRLSPARQGQPRPTTPATTTLQGDPTRLHLDDIRCARAVNFVQFCKQKGVKAM